jgi:hypothetical protein
MTRFEEYCERQTARFGARFVQPSGTPELIAAYNDQARYEVDVDGAGPEWIKRGRVSLSTGWQPTFLLILSRRSLGSSIHLDSRSIILRKVGK